MLEAQHTLSQSGQNVPRRLINFIEVTDQPVIVRGFGMAAGEQYGVEYSLSGLNMWAPFAPNGYQKFLSVDRNPVPLATPGKYRVRAIGAHSGNARFDTIFATTSHEWLLEYVEPIVIAGEPGPPGLDGATGATGDTGSPGSSGSTQIHVPLATGDWVDSTMVGYPSLIMDTTFNRLTYFTPFIKPLNCTVNRIGLTIQNEPTSAFLLGVYDSDGIQNFYPGTLLATSIELSGSGIFASDYFDAPIQIVAGHLYWLAMSNNHANHQVQCFYSGQGGGGSGSVPLSLGLYDGISPFAWSALRVTTLGAGAQPIPAPFPAYSSVGPSDRNIIAAPRIVLQVV